MKTHSKLLAWIAAACATIALSGCMVLSPMMQSAMQSSVEANATPESMGISTSSYRGHDCASLASLAQAFAKSQNDPATEPFTRKTQGWNLDAVNQVRSEQGCTGGGTPKVASSGEVPMHGFCWYSEPGGTGTTYISTVFAYVDWYADLGQHEQKEFESYLKSRYAPAASTALCQAEDTRPRADAAREKLWGQMFGNLSSRRVAVTWTPVSKPPPRKLAAKGKAAAAPTTAATAAPVATSSAPAASAGKVTGLQLTTLDEATAKKLSLNPAQGALVSDVAKGGTGAKAGLRVQDVIVEIGGQEVRTPQDAQAILDAMRPGFNAPLRVWRARKMHELMLEVAETR
jgi:hypothetical protein